MLHWQLFLGNISSLYLFEPKLHIIHLLILILRLHNESCWGGIKLRIISCDTLSLCVIILLQTPYQSAFSADAFEHLKVVVDQSAISLGDLLLNAVVKICGTPNELALLYYFFIDQLV